MLTRASPSLGSGSWRSAPTGSRRGRFPGHRTRDGVQACSACGDDYRSDQAHHHLGGRAKTPLIPSAIKGFRGSLWRYRWSPEANASLNYSTTGTLIAEMKFAFRKHVFTTRFALALWDVEFSTAFPSVNRSRIGPPSDGHEIALCRNGREHVAMLHLSICPSGGGRGALLAAPHAGGGPAAVPEHVELLFPSVVAVLVVLIHAQIDLVHCLLLLARTSRYLVIRR